MQTTRILIADDHPVVRQGLRRIVEEAPGLIVAGEAGNGDEAVEMATTLPLDLVLLDVGMPGPGVLEVLRGIRAVRSTLPILVLSVHGEDQYALRTLRAGASGYLTKDRTSEELVAAIRHVTSGRRYIGPALAEALAGHLAEDGSVPLHASLSDREHQVLCLLGSGSTVGEIAARLELSPKTVSTYRARVIEKLGVRTNADLIRYAVEYGLVV